MENRLFRIKIKFGHMVFNQVTNIENLVQSSQLLYHYGQKYGRVKQSQPFLYLPQYCIRPNFLFSMKDQNHIVGTIGILQGEHLPAYDIYQNDIDHMEIGAGKRVELSSLAIHTHYQHQNLIYDLHSSAVLLAIFKLRAKHIFIQVESRKVPLYERYFFKRIGRSYLVDASHDMTSSLLYMDVERVWREIGRRYEGQSNTVVMMNILEFFGVYDRYKKLSLMQLRDMSMSWNMNDLHFYQKVCGQI